MQHTPRSARASAPASNENSLPFEPALESLTAAQVKPAVEDPVPVVRTDRGESAAAKRRNCDLPVLHMLTRADK